MRCYRCNSVLSKSDMCEGCGVDVTIYKKIVKMSNTYYNMGLSKAKVRDLSGAAELLRRSVRIDKTNIKARNLLGLVYYEMGECVEALSEWVISKNIKSEKNIADDYIKDIQSNPNKLNTLNQTIRKFNKALGYAWEDNDDLAIIQLKKVLSLNPNLIKGHQLLALLFMKRGEYERARKTLNKALRIDRCNVLTIRYLDAVDEATAKPDSAKKQGSKAREKELEREALSGNDVIIPPSSYKETNYALVTFINVIIGIVIGAAMVFFLVTPAKESSAAEEYKATITDYASKLDKSNASVASLESQIESLTAERDEYKAKVDSAAAVAQKSENMDKLLQAANTLLSTKDGADIEIEGEDAGKIADELVALGDVSEESEAFKDLYDTLKTATFGKAGGYYYNQGSQYANTNDWDNAIKMYIKCVAIDDRNPAFLYKLAKSLNKKNNGVNTEEAISYFEKVIEIAPTSEYAGYARQYLN